ncbi:MAG: hypothetical protein IJJ42_07325 [Clostridia bacterium]|nr:hypothetical protein [Clostridia bacterium]
MRLLAIAVLLLSLLFSCAPSYTSAETAAEIQKYAAEAADSLTDTGASSSPDIQYLLLLQDFRMSTANCWWIRRK